VFACAIKSTLLFALTILFKGLYGQVEIKQFEMRGTHKHLDFSWSIAGDYEGKIPNVLSELTWDNIRSVGIDHALELRVMKMPVKFRFAYDWVCAGQATDSDYTTDNRGTIGNRKVFNSNNGKSIEAQALFSFFDKIKLNTGILFRDQTLTLDHAINSSTYNARWFGGMVESEKEVRLGDHLYANAKVKIAGARYLSTANWILRQDLGHPRSFAQDAYDFWFGSCLELGCVIKTFKIALMFSFDLNQSIKGADVLHFRSGDVALTRFNGVKWKRRTVGIVFKKNFKNR